MQAKRILSGETPKKIGEKITLSGWVRNIRPHGRIAFFDLRDRDGIVQVVATDEKLVEKVSSLSHEDVVVVKGLVKKRDERYINEKISTGKVEVLTEDIEILTKADSMPFDIGGQELNLELPTLLDNRSLSLRHPRIASIFKIQEVILEAFREKAKEMKCTEIVVPTIVASATEGGAELFPIKYYDHQAYLSQSPQLYKQIMVGVFERVFTIAKAYRAEPSVTTRHLSETTQMDMELGFTQFDELISALEEVAVGIVKSVEKECKAILEDFGMEKVMLGKIPRLKLREAQEIIYKEYGRDVRAEKDLGPQDESDICHWARENHKSDFAVITHFPTMAKPFYTMPDPNNREYSLSYDLLFRGVEVLSGSQRINELQDLLNSLRDRGMDASRFQMYLMSFQYGMPPEGGFSFGLERLTMKFLNLRNVREASLFPRDMERIDERLSS